MWLGGQQGQMTCLTEVWYLESIQLQPQRKWRAAGKHGCTPLGGSCFLCMTPAHLGHWVGVSCQCQVGSGNANGPLPHCIRVPLLVSAFSFCVSRQQDAELLPLLKQSELCIWLWSPAVLFSTKKTDRLPLRTTDETQLCLSEAAVLDVQPPPLSVSLCKNP